MNIFSSIDNGHYGALDGLTIVGDEWLLESTNQLFLTADVNIDGTKEQLDISQGSV